MSIVIGRLTANADEIVGSAADETIEVPSSTTNLRDADTLDGGAGFDTLLFERTVSLGINFLNMTGVTRVEELNFIAAPSAIVTLNTSTILQSDTNRLRLTFDADPVDLDLRDVDPTAGAVVEINGTGRVTLRDAPGQVLHVSDLVESSRIIGGEGRDILIGAMSQDGFDGGLGDDSLSGGGGDDTLTGGADQDILLGGAGNDSLEGGAGFDVITGGTGNNTVTGGAEADTFVVSAGEALTITDFDVTDPHERIDLRAITGSYGFADLTLTTVSGGVRITLPAGAATITLTGLSVGDLSAINFIFPGSTIVTSATGLGRPADFEFSDGSDAFVGGTGDQVFELKGSFTKLGSDDTFDGGAGEGDVLRIWGQDRVFNEIRAPGVSRVEIIDMSGATGSLEAQVTQAMVDSSDSGKITVRHGANDIIMLTGDVASASSVIVEGSGVVTLRDVDGQGVTVSDFYGGHVIGQNKNDIIHGGALDDTLEGSGGDDRIDGGSGGNDSLNGGDGNDTLTSQGGSDTLTGGVGTDRFVIAGIPAGDHLIRITDFAGAANFETIDLRAWSIGFDDLTMSQSGAAAHVVLSDGRVILQLDDYQASALTDADFITFGEAVPEQYVLSSGADTILGGDADDLIDLIGQISQLDNEIDSIDGGGGFDTLRVFGSDRSLGPPRLEALHSIEAIDLTAATGTHSVAVDDALASQSGNGSLLVRFGAADLDVNSGGLTDASQLVLEGLGLVTLSSGTLGQMVTISDQQAGNIQSGNDATIVVGGSRNDTIRGDFGDDTLSGNGGDDSITGGEGNDILTAGAGDDTLRGGDGNDRLVADGGANVLDGGAGFDQYVIRANSEGTIIEDFDPGNFVERIDLTSLTSKTSIADLTITQEGADARVLGTGLDLLLRNVSGADLDAGNFLFEGQDPLLFRVAAGSTNQQLQDLFDGAPAGAVIEIAAGTYSITQTLHISRGDITVRGAGEGQTIFQTNIALADAGQTILVQPFDLGDRYGTLTADAAEGSMTIQLPDYEALRLGDPTVDYEPFKVGDLIFITQPNDAEWLAASGNELWREPEAETDIDAELYFLRETRSRIVSIDDNGVATLAEALPYSFEADKALILKSTFLSDVHLSDFSIVGNFGADPDPFLFENTMEEWASIAALELDGVRDSHIANISITNPAAHAFKWQRAYETTADSLSAEGAHNKSGSSGYHFYLQESFANTLTNLTSVAARHAVLTSSYNAEHYNTLHLLFSDRDINFHGSPDDGNAIVVDRMIQNYPLGITDTTPQWQAVHPGVVGLHPASDIEGNDVTFRYLRSGERSDRVVAHVDGGDIATNVGSDEVIGQDGNDTVSGGQGNDLLRGNGGDDSLQGDDGKDTLYGGLGNDTLRGGGDNDLVYGGDGDDFLNGGANGDTLFGGAGSDTFLRNYGDFIDTYQDFEAGPGADVMLISGSAYTRFSELALRQVGDDVVLDFGPTGSTLFQNTVLADLTADNFAFAKDDEPGQDLTLKAVEFVAVGTGKDDIFRVGRAHIDSPDFRIVAGAGYDEVAINQSSINADLGATGDYSGVEEFDLSAINRVTLMVDNALVSQSSSRKLYLDVGDTGLSVQLDVGPLGKGKNVYIVGSREVQLTGDREHVVRSGSEIGVNIVGDTQRDVIFGSMTGDVISGGAGDDVLYGLAGDDTLSGGTGIDTLHGGPGSDVYYITDSEDRIGEKGRWEGQDHVISSVNYRIDKAHVETMQLIGTAQIGAGNSLRNLIVGNDGNNILDGGKDVDTLVGGAGDDIYLLRSPGDLAVEDADGGIDSVRAYRNVTLDANIENLYIQAVRDKDGRPVHGTSGFGNDLDNTIYGNIFDNTIGGGAGNDKLRGNTGADRFVFNTALEAGNVDRILDFSRTEGDSLMLDDAIFASIAKGLLREQNFVAGTDAQTDMQFIVYDRASGHLWYDADGSGSLDKSLIATFDGTAQILAGDILVY
ncbi:MAG: calcium-binding protein [Jannaschia sp.]